MLGSGAVASTIQPCFRGVARSALALLLSFSIATPAAFAAGGGALAGLIEKAKGQVAEAEFDAALATIGDALKDPSNTDETLASLYQLQGVTYVYVGHEDKARAAFQRLLEANPEYELPKGTSAKIRSLFDAVREDVKKAAPRPVKVEHDGPGELRPNQPAEFSATIVGMGPGGRAKLFYRSSGSGGYSSVGFVAGSEKNEYLATLPAFALPAQKASSSLEYYLEVADLSSGRRIGGMGGPLDPLKVKVLAGSRGKEKDADPAEVNEDAVYKKWWFWAIVGVAAAGATAAIVIPLTAEKRAILPVTVKVQQ